MNRCTRLTAAVFGTAALVLALTACGGGGSGGMNAPVPQPNGANGTMPTSMPMTAPMQTGAASTTLVDTDTSNLDDNDVDDPMSVLKHLNTITTIGSTVDPINGDQNPYGLDIAKVSAGKLSAGDLVICNFNNNNALGNVQGQGTTIIALHPLPGSNPLHIIQSEELTGCNALALAPNNFIWSAAFVDNDNPIVSPNGAFITALDAGPWNHPFGEAFAGRPGPFGAAAFYVTNAGDGSIVRVNIRLGKPFTFDVIATKFPVNHGPPGSILAPSGLQYDAQRDRLFIVDGTNNAVYVLRHVSTIPAHGLSVAPSGTSFTGPFRRRARVVFLGRPLNGPISSALLPGGHLAIGNTLDPTGKNLMVEITAHGKLLDVKNVDTGAAGALFGMVATTRFGHINLYFNDDNDNTLKDLVP